jgi:hypothetical protein
MLFQNLIMSQPSFYFSYNHGQIALGEDTETSQWLFQEHKSLQDQFDPTDCEITQTLTCNSLDDAIGKSFEGLEKRLLENLIPVLGDYTKGVIDEVTEQLPRDTDPVELPTAKIAIFDTPCPEKEAPDHVILVRAFNYYYTATRMISIPVS